MSEIELPRDNAHLVNRLYIQEEELAKWKALAGELKFWMDELPRVFTNQHEGKCNCASCKVTAKARSMGLE